MNTNIATSGAASVTVDEDVLADMRAHAAVAYPYECCGALIAAGGAIVEAFALPNTTAEGAARRFMVGPDDYRVAERRARAGGGVLAGFYHSHPDHPARPSQHDLEHAWPNLTYLILSVVSGRPADITAWRLRDDRGAFEQGEIACRARF